MRPYQFFELEGYNRKPFHSKTIGLYSCQSNTFEPTRWLTLFQSRLTSVQSLMNQLCLEIEQLYSETSCTIMLFNPQKQCFYVGASPSQSDRYIQSLNGITLTVNQHEKKKTLPSHPYHLVDQQRILRSLISLRACQSLCHPFLSLRNPTTNWTICCKSAL